MTTSPVTGAIIDDETLSTVSWAAVIAGGVASAAVTLVLLAFGVGVGFSVVSPWSNQGVSGPTVALGAGIFLVAMAMLASTVGGYLAGRLRRRWAGVHQDEVYFRDTAHGFLAWALATVLSATVMGSATTHILGGVTAGAAPAIVASGASPTDSTVDVLLRSDSATPPTAAVDQTATRAELGRLLAGVTRKGGDLTAPDRAYVAKIVANRTGLSQADAEKRVNDTIVQAKKTADDARKLAAKLSLWLAASLLAGALASVLAATEGGLLRDSEWHQPGWRPGAFGTERSPR